MESFDVLVVGGGTTGSFLARRLAERGLRVLVAEKEGEGAIGSNYDIFHLGAKDIARWALPPPRTGDGAWAFEFSGSAAYSALGRHPKPSSGAVVGLHKREYTVAMRRRAEEAGATFAYGAEFRGFLFEGGRIAGARLESDAGSRELRCRLVADCSGIPSAARTSLPEGYGVETFALGPRDLFYVVLRYVAYPEGGTPVTGTRSWPFYKAWEAPQADPKGAIIGVGASLGYDRAERAFELFSKAIELPPYTLQRIERGTTPYRRPPYSFVADGFVVLGDAACLTRPGSGEGCASALVQAEIVAEVAQAALRGGAYPSRELLWPINGRYIEAQGREYAGLLATLAGAVAGSAEENEYLFARDIVFSRKTFASLDGGVSFSAAELLRMGLFLGLGFLGGKLRASTIGALLGAARKAELIKKHYAAFPASPGGYEAWTREAEELWASAGSMADQVL